MQMSVEYLDEDLYKVALKGADLRLLSQLQGVKTYCELQQAEVCSQLEQQRLNRVERKHLNDTARMLKARHSLLSEAVEILESYESRMLDPHARVSFAGGMLGLMRTIKCTHVKHQMG